MSLVSILSTIQFWFLQNGKDLPGRIMNILTRGAQANGWETSPASKVASTKDILTPSAEPLPSPRFQDGILYGVERVFSFPMGFQNERRPNGPVQEAFG